MTLLVFHDDIFSQNIKYLRNKQHLSQKELAYKSGINVFWLRGIERGRYRAEILASDYWNLCKALNVPPHIIGARYLQ